MTALAEKLRAIADRLEAAEAERVACMDMLAAFLQGWQTDGRTVEPWDDGDSTAALVAAEAAAEDAPTSVASRAPLEEGPAGADGAGHTPAAGTQPAPTLSAKSLLPAKDRAALRPVRATAKEEPFGQPFPCPDCDRSFGSPQALGVHRRHRHGHRAVPGARMACPDCGADVRVDRLTRHQRESHPGTPPTPVLKHGEEWFLCDRCPERYRTAEALGEHRGAHRPAPRGQPVGRPSLAASAIGGQLGS